MAKLTSKTIMEEIRDTLNEQIGDWASTIHLMERYEESIRADERGKIFTKEELEILEGVADYQYQVSFPGSDYEKKCHELVMKLEKLSKLGNEKHE